MKKINKKLIFSFSILILFLLVNSVSAQYLGFEVGESTGLSRADVRLNTMFIIKNALGVLGVVALVIIIYSGFRWMTAGGNDDQITEAKKWLTRSIIGLAIILSAYSITTFVTNLLIKSTMPQGGVNVREFGNYWTD